MKKRKPPKNLDTYMPAKQAAESLHRLADKLHGSTTSDTVLVKWSMQIWTYDPGPPEPEEPR